MLIIPTVQLSFPKAHVETDEEAKPGGRSLQHTVFISLRGVLFPLFPEFDQPSCFIEYTDDGSGILSCFCRSPIIPTVRIPPFGQTALQHEDL